MDILEPFPMVIEQRKFLVVAIDYFTKWMEAKPLTQIIIKKMQDFIWKLIIYRFGLPQVIIIDNEW